VRTALSEILFGININTILEIADLVVDVDAYFEVVGEGLVDEASRRHDPAPVLVVQEERHRPVEHDRVSDAGAHLQHRDAARLYS